MSDAIPLESAIVKRIVRRLEREPGCWLIKTHGSVMGRRGVPDILGCYMGRMFALEVKRPEVGKVSESQRHEMGKLANAGAFVAVVESLEDAIGVLGLNG